VLCPLITALEEKLSVFGTDNLTSTNARLLHGMADSLTLLRSCPPVRMNISGTEEETKAHYTKWMEKAGINDKNSTGLSFPIKWMIDMLVAAHAEEGYDEVLTSTLESVAGILMGVMKHQQVVLDHGPVLNPLRNLNMELFCKYQKYFLTAYSYDTLIQQINEACAAPNQTEQAQNTSCDISLEIASYIDWEIMQIQQRIEWRGGAFGLGHGLFKSFLATIVDPQCKWAQETLNGSQEKYRKWARNLVNLVEKEVAGSEIVWKMSTWGAVEKQLNKDFPEASQRSFLENNHYGYFPGRKPDSKKESAVCFHLSLRPRIAEIINRQAAVDSKQPNLSTLAKAAYAAMTRIGTNTHRHMTNLMGVLSQSVISDFDRTLNLVMQRTLPTPNAMERARNIDQALIPLLKIRKNPQNVPYMMTLLKEATFHSCQEEKKEAVSSSGVTQVAIGTKLRMSWKAIAEIVLEAHHAYIHTQTYTQDEFKNLIW
jgi:hypothetical protein